MKKSYNFSKITITVCLLFIQLVVTAQKDVYLVIGQSNAAGRATIEAEDMVTLTGVDLYNGTSWESAVNTAVADGGLNRYSTIQNPAQDQGLNFSYTFGRMLNEVTGDQIGLVVNARGGTSIDSWAKGHVDDYYGEAITETTAALALGGSTLKGVLWHQGESDRNDASYIAKLTTLISDLRTDLGIATLPVIVGQLSMQRTDNGTFNTTIEALAVSNTDYAATDGLQTTDRTHFNSNAQRVLGYRYAAKVLEMVYGYTYVQNQIMYVTEDAYVRGGTNSGTAYGISDAEILRIKEVASNANNSRRGLLKFDVSALTGTADRLVVDATLMLNSDGTFTAPPLDVSFYDIGTSWSESTVVWDDVVADFATAISASTTTFDEDTADDDGDGDSDELIHGGADLTEFIKDEYDLGTSTIALGLKSETDGPPQFKPTTKDHSTDFALRPYIIASYLEVPVVSNSQTTNLAKLTFETDPTDTDPAITDISYTTDKAEFSDGTRDYFIRTDGSDTNATYTYTSNVDLGDYYFTAQDIDDNTNLPVDEVALMTLDRIDISGYENLELRVYLAQIDGQSSGWDNSEVETGENDWLHFNYNIHNGTPGAFNNLLWIESEGINLDPVNGNRNNKDAGIDLDFDGEAERTPATQFGSTFKQFTATITGTGDFLDIVLDFNINGNHEDIAIDNIEIWGTLINDTCSGTNITWNGSVWSNGTGPDITTPAVINGAYTADATNGSFSACSLTVNDDLTIENGYYIEVENDVTVNASATLLVEDDGALVQNVDSATFTNSGTSIVRKSTDVLDNWYNYTYWSSPVSGLTIGTSPLADSNRRYWFDANNYLDVLIEDPGNTNTFTPGSDDIDDNGDDWQTVSDATLMTPGVGYIASSSSSYTGALSYDFDFIGDFNNGDITVPIVYNALNTGGHWNLIGNPYPCALDFDAFVTNNPGIVDGIAYLWSHATGFSSTANGNEVANFSQSDYIIINTGSGSVNNSPGTLLEYIPTGQSFFVAGLSNANATFNNSMRIKNPGSNGQFFKNSNTKNKSVSQANKLWINLTSDIGVFNQVLIAYVDGATNNYDGMSYDAPRNLTSGVASIIYTLLEDKSDKKFAIQGKSKESISESEVIPLGFYTSTESATIYELSIDHLQGDFLTSNTVYLKDNYLNKTHNLSESAYNFLSNIYALYLFSFRSNQWFARQDFYK